MTRCEWPKLPVSFMTRRCTRLRVMSVRSIKPLTETRCRPDEAPGDQGRVALPCLGRSRVRRAEAELVLPRVEADTRGARRRPPADVQRQGVLAASARRSTAVQGRVQIGRAHV